VKLTLIMNVVMLNIYSIRNKEMRLGINMKMQKIVLNPERNVTLTAFIQDVDGEFGIGRKDPLFLILTRRGLFFSVLIGKLR